MSTHEPWSSMRALKEISRLASTLENRPEARDRLIRLLDSNEFSASERSIVDSLCSTLGLYPYITNIGAQDSSELLAYEFHRPLHEKDPKMRFHADQHKAYRHLMDGKSLILSAPTSFGKSAILDSLLLSRKWKNVVVIVPTIALMDETRRRVSQLNIDAKVVTQVDQERSTSNVFILTQERYFELGSIPVDLFVIDEFYKLGSEDLYGTRKTLLNLAWRRLRDTKAQFYLIGPNIDRLDERLSGLQELMTTSDFRTVAVNVDDRTHVDDPASDLVGFLSARQDETTLVFTASPARADSLANRIAKLNLLAADSIPATTIAAWIAMNYDSAWSVGQALARGVGTHSGPMPRSLQRIMVRLFNDGHIPVLVCTSTLIEGVNTSAKNVVIYDKKIDGSPIDFFTFSNIKGRAGRMLRHFVGNVVTYVNEPAKTAVELDIPIDTQSDGASLSTLVHLDASELAGGAKERVQHLFEQVDISVETLRQNKGLDPDLQIAAARHLALHPSETSQLGWSGMPSTPELRYTLKFAFLNLTISRQRQGVNADMLWGMLQNARFNALDFAAQVDQQSKYARKDQDRNDVVQTVLRFQRNWMGFTIPSLLRGLQNIQVEVSRNIGVAPANYELAIREIENLYLPNGIAKLEEFGLPIPVSTKLVDQGLHGENIDQLMEKLKVLSRRQDVRGRLSLAELWILDDVVAGLG